MPPQRESYAPKRGIHPPYATGQVAGPGPKDNTVVLPGAPGSHLLKRTMIKDCIGRCRATAYDLPKDVMHVFGYDQEKDKAGAGDCIGGWDQFTPSAPASSQRSFVKTNHEALKAGCITAKSQRDYQISHPDIYGAQQQPGRMPTLKNKVPFDGPYGYAAASREEKLTQVIEGEFMGKGDDEADYPDIKAVHKANKLPLPKPTLASAGKDVRNKVEPEPKTHFCMKRFKNIKSRL